MTPAREDGSLDTQCRSSGGGKWLLSRYILKVEAKVFSNTGHGVCDQETSEG